MNWVVAPEYALPWVKQFALARVWSPPYLPLRIALRLSPRRIEARLMVRRALGFIAARRIPRDATTVIAPSLCARPIFAEAKRRGLRTVLVQDLPCLRRLHHDLDRACSAHPGSKFLKNYRAPASAIVEQESEWVLADEVRVRGAYAAKIVSDAGATVPDQLAPRSVDLNRVVDAPPENLVRSGAGARPLSGSNHPSREEAVKEPSRPKRPLRVQLAGIATPRHGIFELLAAQGQLDFELIVRTGEGLEPGDLLSRRGVTRAGQPDVVVAPSWCEAHLPEVHDAVARGVPVIATSQASGWLGGAVTRVEPGDVPALVRALS